MHASLDMRRASIGVTRDPEVSVIIGARNVESYIEAAVGSALMQTNVDVEVLVVDDASTDNTAALVERLASRDARVRLIRRDRVGGPSRARADAIAEAHGTWLAVLDGDDLMAPERCRTLIDLAEAAAADVVVDKLQRFSDGAPEVEASADVSNEGHAAYFLDLASFISGNTVFSSSGRDFRAVKPIFRSAFVREAAISYREDLPVGEDYHICLACLNAGANFLVSEAPLYKYRIRHGSQSWRVNSGHIGQMLAAHKELGIEARWGGERTVVDAATRYLRALERAQVFTKIVELTKSHKTISALRLAIARPIAWPLLVRFGLEGLLRRVGLV